MKLIEIAFHKFEHSCFPVELDDNSRQLLKIAWYYGSGSILHSLEKISPECRKALVASYCEEMVLFEEGLRRDLKDGLSNLRPYDGPSAG